MFSSRVPDDLEPNRLARARAETGPSPFDLTISNPTECGFEYPADLLVPLADPAGLRYAPHPLGLPTAREAVASYYRDHGVAIDPGRIVLTASSSEAYGFLFRLLCEPGDDVLVPVPSYPLFEHLARLDAVRALPWPLDPGAGWQPHLPDAPPPRARAAIVVHPNNPTGSEVVPREASSLAGACRDRGLALVADEVFLDYPLEPDRRFASFAANRECLTFTLGGLSKSVGLPQMKLSWIAVSGPEREASEAIRRLEFLADSYLSVATPVQRALPRLLARGTAVRAEILDRCRRNLASLAARLAGAGASNLERPLGGWTAVVRYPSLVDEETLCLDALREDGVSVMPGYFFDFPSPGYLVVSLLPPPAIFDEGIARLAERLRRLA